MPRTRSMKSLPTLVQLDVPRLRKRKSDRDVPPPPTSPVVFESDTQQVKLEEQSVDDGSTEKSTRTLRSKSLKLEVDGIKITPPKARGLRKRKSENDVVRDKPKVPNGLCPPIPALPDISCPPIPAPSDASCPPIPAPSEASSPPILAPSDASSPPILAPFDASCPPILALPDIQIQKKLEEEIEKLKEENKFCCDTIKTLEKKVENAEQGRDNLVLHIKKIEAEHKEELERLNQPIPAPSYASCPPILALPDIQIQKKLEEEIEKLKEENKFCCDTIKTMEKKVENAEQGRDNLVLHLKKIKAEHKEELERLNQDQKTYQNTVHEEILQLESKIVGQQNALLRKEKSLIQITKEKEESERELQNTIKGMEDIVTIVKKQNEDVAQKLLKARKKIELYETLK